jgi:nuclear pore complex protein Nup133
VIDPWTSQPAVIDTVLDLFEGATRYIETPTPSPGASAVKGGPIDQLPELASVLLACIQERLEWLGRYNLAFIIINSVR